MVGALAVGVGALAAFVARSLRHREPLLDLRLYRRNQVYRAATVTTGLTGMILFGSGLVFPLYLQIGQGQSVLATGLRLLGLGAATALVMPAAGRLTDRHGGGVVSAIGCATLVAVSVAFALLPLDAGEVVIQIVLALFGAATAFAAVPAGIAAYKTVTPEQLPDATTTVNIVQRVGGALGGALFAVVIARNLPDDPEGAFRHAFWADRPHRSARPAVRAVAPPRPARAGPRRRPHGTIWSDGMRSPSGRGISARRARCGRSGRCVATGRTSRHQRPGRVRPRRCRCRCRCGRAARSVAG